MKDRFERLAALTRGAAVVTLGVGAVAAGCTKSEPASQPAVAAAGAIESDPAAATADASDGDGGRRRFHRFPIPNAMHHGWRVQDAGSWGGGGADGSSGP